MGGVQAQMSQGAPLRRSAPALNPVEEADPGRRSKNVRQNGITNDPYAHRHHQQLATCTTHCCTWAAQVLTSQRLRKYTTGTFAELMFSQQSNIDINNPFVFISFATSKTNFALLLCILCCFIWNKTKAINVKRILAIDEAWQFMKYDEQRQLYFSLTKHAP